MKSQARMMQTLILGAFALLVVLVGAAFVSNSGEQSMDESAQSITLNALPSIARLTAAGDTLRELEAHADDYVDLAAEARPAGRANIEDDWRRIDRELAVYQALPWFEGEQGLYESTVPSALRAVDEAISRLMIAVDTHEAVETRLMADREVGAKTNEAARRLRAMVRFDSAQADIAVSELAAKHRQVARLKLIFDTLAVALGIGLALLLLWQFRAHDKLARDHSALVEQRARELELFGQRVAHDLLSPLSALTFCLAAFKRAAESDPKLQDALTRARNCVARGQRMVEAVFDFSRAGGQPRPGVSTDLREALDDAREGLREVSGGEPPEVTIESFETCRVACSRGVLTSILGNLMSNAVKYMRDSAEKRITVRVGEKAGRVRVEVEDTGPGIPRDLEGRLFEPYVRGGGVTQPGLGLGLATAKRLCDAHGGEIGVRSTIGRGSVFWFALPAASAASESEPPESTVSVARIR